MIKLLILIFGTTATPIKKIDYCDVPVQHKSLESRIELAIGCSKVNGTQVYRDRNLKELYEQ